MISLLAFVAASYVVPAAWADSYTFIEEEAPPQSVLEGRYMFHVYSLNDSPGPKDAEAQVTFTGFRLRREDGEAPTDARVAVGMLPFEEFGNLLDSTTFCGDPMEGGFEPKFKQHESVAHAHWHVVRSPSDSDVTYDLKRSGPYLMVVAHCKARGGPEKLWISGSVVVKNPYGYLAGTDFGKTRAYVCFALAYVVALLGWGVLSFINRHKLDRIIHSTITCVLVAGLLESVAYVAFYTQANTSPVSRKDSALLLFAQAMGVVKITNFILVFRFDVEDVGACKEQAIVYMVMLVFIAAATLKVTLQSVRHHFAVTDSMWLSSMLAMAVVGAGTFTWVMRGLAGKMQRCRELGEERMLTLYQRMALLALCLVASSTVVACAQYFDVPGQRFTVWYYHALVDDWVPQAIAFAAIVLITCMWQPSEDFQPLSDAAEAEVIGCESSSAPPGKAVEQREQAEAVEFVLDDDDEALA